MGLDMYLKGKRYLHGCFEGADSTIAKKIQDLFPELEGRTGRWDDGSLVTEIGINVGYWRKANHIHAWFVDVVQDGEDDCNVHYVDRGHLIELQEICQRVLNDRTLASKILPVTEGFFFGGTDYGEWYFQDLRDTLEIIDRALSLPSEWSFEYQSSW